MQQAVDAEALKISSAQKNKKERMTKMKKTFRIFLTAAALSSMMAIPAFAAETRDEFKAETSVLNDQMQE